MSSFMMLTIIGLYFIVLLVISRVTSRNESNANFFLAGKSAPWYLVAFGMVGASLSGITFISIPGKVGVENDLGIMATQFSYMQMVLGYLVGYLVVAFVLMPVYYRMNVTSIYSYLAHRFGKEAYKMGAFYFLISRTTGAAIRLLLVANVLQEFAFNDLGVPFPVTVAISIALIWVYTFKGGIKTIIWTDTLQTLFMLIALGMALYLITDALQIADGSLVSTIVDSGMSKWFFLDEFSTTGNHFIKHFLGGMFITIGMTGMDQDMMQKNLACKNIKQAQLNMMSFSAVLLVVNLLFLALGVLLYLYAAKFGIDVPKRTDLLFPEVALRSNLSTAMSVFFLLGLIAAAYSSADSALTSLTTSVCVDFLDIEKREKAKQIKLRKQAHVAMSVVLFFVIIVLHYTLDLTAIGQLIFLAGFTYGPLIGLFAFGILTNKNTHPVAFPIIAVAAPLVTYLMVSNSEDWFDGFVFGALHIVFNSVLTFVLLWLASLPVFREARNSSEVLDR